MKKLAILYEDKNLLIINKPTKLLTINSDKKNTSLYSEASMYVKKKYPKNKIFIVNRLDRDTSGIVVFAKNEELKHKLQEKWNAYAKERMYIGIVENSLPNEQDTLKNYLYEDKTYFVHVSDNSANALEAITKYEVVAYENTYSLLNIHIDTGRKNQIRVQLSHIGNPIIGDKKYKSKRNPISRLGLHAYKLVLVVPGYPKPLTIIADIPKEFKPMFKEEEIWNDYKK